MPQSFVIVTHELFYGASQALRDYLKKKKIKKLLFISHPIRHENNYSYFQIYESGHKVAEYKKKRYLQQTPVGYFVDVILSLFWVWKSKIVIDVYIGVNPLNCIPGLIYRSLGKARKVVFYAIDFVPRRFDKAVLDWIYHLTEKICVKYSDERWAVSPRIAYGREKFLGISSESFLQKIVPIGIWAKDIATKISNFNLQRIVFSGDLLEKQGVQKVLEAISRVKAKIPQIQFIIIGSGEFEDELKKMVDHLKINRNVVFRGWINDQRQMRSILTNCSLAVATYKPSGEDSYNFSYYSDPTKIKTYLSCALPIILTKVPYNSEYLAKRQTAIVVAYDAKSITSAILKLINDRDILMKYKKNALTISRDYSWEKIFKTALGF